MLDLFAQTMPDMPLTFWWVAPVILILLAGAAIIDAFTARVPDPIIFLGLLITTAAQGFATDWPIAAGHLTAGLAVGFLIYGFNLLWYRLKKHDALGMGDAKWTILATATFGLTPAAIAWGLGAWLALLWLGLMRLANKRSRHVYFAPFLFVSLLAGIWLVRLR